MSVIASAASLLLSAAPAFADETNTSNLQYLSLWTYYSPSTCVAFAVGLEQTNYPTETWAAITGSAEDGGTLSFSASLKGYVGISYTPSNDCEDAYTVNAYDIAQYGELLKYNSSTGQWYVCNVNPVNGPYGAPFMSNTSATWGLKFVGGAGSEGGCGPGWYYVAAIGYVWQNGAWRGTEPNLVQTPSVIYMN